MPDWVLLAVAGGIASVQIGVPLGRTCAMWCRYRWIFRREIRHGQEAAAAFLLYTNPDHRIKVLTWRRTIRAWWIHLLLFGVVFEGLRLMLAWTIKPEFVVQELLPSMLTIGALVIVAFATLIANYVKAKLEVRRARRRQKMLMDLIVLVQQSFPSDRKVESWRPIHTMLVGTIFDALKLEFRLGIAMDFSRGQDNHGTTTSNRALVNGLVDVFNNHVLPVLTDNPEAARIEKG